MWPIIGSSRYQKMRFNEEYCKCTVYFTDFTAVFHPPCGSLLNNWLINTLSITLPGQPGDIQGVINLISRTRTGSICYIISSNVYLSPNKDSPTAYKTSDICRQRSIQCPLPSTICSLSPKIRRNTARSLCSLLGKWQSCM